MKKKIFLTVILLRIAFSSYSQSFNAGFLFDPGLTLGTEFMPNSAVNDSVDFKLVKYKFQVTLPVKTKFGLPNLSFKDFSFKKVNAKASQLFVSANFSVHQPSFSSGNNFSKIYTGGLGVIAVSGNVKKNTWLYGGNIYFSENKTTITRSPNPNLRGYLLKVNLKNSNLIYFYGASLTFNQGKYYPIPILGARIRLSKRLNTNLVFPIQLKLIYEVNKKTHIDLATNLDGINAISREGSSFKNINRTTNYQQLKSYFGINTKFGSHYKVFFETGYVSFREIRTINRDYTQTISPSFYFSFSINYHFGISVLNHFINEME
jgi:hypothetical protein